jgi:hypothetical protein
MRKFWRIGLILVIGLAACGDKKAEQAKTLQQEIQALLATTAGPDKVLTYGDVTVTPDGDSFTVTVDKVALALPEVTPVDLGKISFKVTPDGDDIRKFSDVTLPSSVTVKGADGKAVNIAMALDHANGSWSKKLDLLLSADVLLKSLEASEPTSDSKLAASDIFYQVQSKDNGQGVYDQSGAVGAKLLTISDKDGQFSVGDLKLGSAVAGAKLAELVTARDDWQKAAAGGKSEDVLPLLGKMFTLIKSMSFNLSSGQISVATGGAPIFTLGGFGFDFAMKNTDQPKVAVTSSLNYTGLSIAELKALVGGLGTEILPTEFGMTVQVDDLPMSAIMDSWSKTLPDTKMTDENAMMGTGMMAAGAAIQAIQQATVKMTVSDGKLKAPGLTGSFTADVTNDLKAPTGFTGVANVELSDLDALIAKGQQYADQPTTAEIVGMLQMMRALADHTKDASGKTVDRFKITMDAQGNPLVNGKSLMPPAEAAPAEQPSNGDTGTGSGTTTSP